jgi:hypothetical protein
MASKIEIVGAASFNTGNGALVSLDDISDGDLALAIDLNYENRVKAMLTQHAWKFARRTAVLDRLEVTPEAPWTGLYNGPTGMLSLHYVQITTTGQRIDHEERDLPTGRAIAVIGDSPSDSLTAVFTYRTSEAVFPPDFALVLQTYMEAIFLSGLAEQRQEARAREKQAEFMEQKARVRDQRSSTATDPNEWDLAAARRSGSRWLYRRA